MWATLQIVESDLIRSHHARPCPCLDRHIANGHASFHRQRPNGTASILKHVALATTCRNLRDNGQDDVLGGDPRSQGSLNVDCHGLEWLQRKCLGGKYVLNLAGSNTHRERPKSSVGRSMRIPTNHRDTRHGQSKLWTNHVNNALVLISQ